MVSKRFSSISLMAVFTLLAVLGGWVLPNDRLAQAAATVWYVAPGGNCGGTITLCYGTIQAAVDAAQDGDEIRIAAGTYTGVNTQGGKPQVVYIAKSLTLRGGYAVGDWGPPNPAVNITELNAQVLGRAAYITGASTVVTLNGLRFTYGDANGLGGHAPTSYENYDAGGTVYIDQAAVTLNDCQISDGAAPSGGYGGGLYIHNGTLTATRVLWQTNQAGHGGAAYLYRTTTHIADSVVQNNSTTTMNGDGPALTVSGGAFVLSDSVIESNTAAEKAPFSGALSVNADPFLIETSVISGTVYSSGVTLSGVGTLRNSQIQANEYGGVRISGTSNATVSLSRNHIHHNRNTYVASYGGGVYVDPALTGWVTVSDNLIEENTVGQAVQFPYDDGHGGGVAINGDRVTLERNVIRNNSAIGFLHAGLYRYGGLGGGIHIRGNPILRNNVIVENHATYEGSGLYIRGSAPELYHNTIAHNAGADDATGIYVAEASSTQRAQPKLWNTIIVSQTVGIYVKGDVVQNIVNADGILWYGNIVNTGGTGICFLSNEHTGAPLFVAPSDGDYHINSGSAAIDQGVSAGVTHDMDGEPRLGVPDLGADEYWAPGALKHVYLPSVLKQ